MDFSSSIIADFAVIMAVAAVVTFVFHKLKQPLILGYLIAGVIIGPYSPPFSLVTNLDILNAIADLGMILLLFNVGLQFPIGKFKKVGTRVFLSISLIEITLMFLISFGVGMMLRWPYLDSLFLGAALASSSTVIITKVLRDMGHLKDLSALIMMGVLIVEDLIVVLLLSGITSIVGKISWTLSGFGWDVGKIVLFIGGTVLVGLFLIPRIIDRVATPDKETHSDHNEVLLLVALGLCFGFAMLSNMAGLSVAIGAFLIGIFIASAKSADRVGSITTYIKDMFAAAFFVSMGALIDLSQFRDFLIPALLVTAVMIVGKVVGCGLGTKLFKYDTLTALKVGLGMGQIGEFAFIVMKVGQDLEVISPFLFPTVGVAVAITSFLTPYMIKLSYTFKPIKVEQN